MPVYIYAYTHRQINILSTDIYLFLIYPIHTNSVYKTQYIPLNKYVYIQIFILLIYIDNKKSRIHTINYKKCQVILFIKHNIFLFFYYKICYN